MSSRKEQKAQKKQERLKAEQEAMARVQNKKRLTVLMAFAATCCVVAAFLVISSSQDSAQKIKGGPETAAQLSGIKQQGQTLGNPSAPVQIVEFADLQCPFCRDFSNKLLPDLVSKYVRSGKVKISIEPLGFIGPQSEQAARYALVAGQQGKMWNFLEIFYKNQMAENSGYADAKFLASVGRAAGLSPLPTKAKLQSPAIDKAYQAAQARAGKEAIDTTPSFLIGTSEKNLQRLDQASISSQGLRAAIEALSK